MIDIEGFKDFLYEEELSENTISAYLYTMGKYSEMFDDITKPNLIAFKKHLTENFKPKTVNNRIAAIMKYCGYKKINVSLKQVKAQKQTHIDNVITAEQYETLMNGLKADGDIRWYINIALIAKTGMRISEALRVTKKDLLSGSVTMPAKAHLRTIYFPKSLTNDILPLLEGTGENETVMKNHLNKPITSRGVSGKMKVFADMYGIPKEVMHPHSFRHFFALEFLKRNNNIALLADILGHSNVNITQIYLRQSQEQQKDAVDRAVDW